MATRAHLEGNKRYLATLDEIRIRLPKGRKEEIKALAEAAGQSVNAYIARAVAELEEREAAGGGNP